MKERVYDYTIIDLKGGSKGILIHEAYAITGSNFQTWTTYNINGTDYPILMGSLMRDISAKKTYMFNETSWVEQ